MRRMFTVVALVETVTWVLLLVAVGYKYGAGHPVGVEVMGPLHGLAFIGYFVLVVLLREAEHLSVRTAGLLLLAALVPFGGWAAERRLLPPRTAGGEQANPAS